MERLHSKGIWKVCETNHNHLLIDNNLVDFTNSSLGTYSKLHNTKLAAAAPDLLAALDEAIDLLKQNNVYIPLSIEDAIKKATV